MKINNISFVVDKAFQNNKLFEKEFNDLDFTFWNYLKSSFNSLSVNINTHDIFDPNNADVIIYSDYKKKINNKDKLHVLIALESIAVIPAIYRKSYYDKFDLVFSWYDKIIDYKKIFPINFSQDLKPKKYKSFSQRPNLICNISSNKFSNYENELYSERIKVFEFFKDKPEVFSLYGYGWDKSYKFPKIYNYFKFLSQNKLFRILGKILILIFLKLRIEKLVFQSYNFYKGVVNSKQEALDKHKFCLCFENVKDVDFFITEKIFDCFINGIIPIYLGSDNIHYKIPSNTFIDYRKFKNVDEMFKFISKIDEKDFENYQKNMYNFLVSNNSKEFESKYVSNIVLKKIIKSFKSKKTII